MTTTLASNTGRSKLLGWLKEAAIMVGVAGAVLLAVGIMRGKGGGKAVDVDQVAPAFEVARADGAGRLSSDELRGKPIVLTFWATWCGACRDELPTLESMYRRVGDRVAFVPVSKESSDKIMRYRTAQRFTLPMYVGASPFQAYGIEAIPTTIIIGPDGRILDEMTGGIDTARIEEIASEYDPR